jgi:hypothetical protein
MPDIWSKDASTCCGFGRHCEMSAPTTIEPSLPTVVRTGKHATARRPNRILLAGLSVAFVAALTTLFYFIAVRTVIPDSDGATAVLEGQSMAAGHLTLNGWALSLDSFWTIDALFNTVGVWVLGVRSTLLDLVPAFVAALVVLAGVLLARIGRRGAAGIAAAVPVLAILGLPNNYLSYFFLRGVAHIGTTLWCLLAFLVLAWKPSRVKWFVGVAFLAAGLLGDLQMVGLGVAPVFLAGIVTMLRTRRLREGLPLAGAAIASFALAGMVRGLATLVGTYTIGNVQPSASKSQVVSNLKDLPAAGTSLLGVLRHVSGTLWAPEIGHVVMLGVFCSAIVVFAFRLIMGIIKGSSRADYRTGRIRADAVVQTIKNTDPPVGRAIESWRVDDLLLLACLCGMVVFVKLAAANDFNYRRYLTAAVIFGAILAARLVGELVSRVRSTRFIWTTAVVSLAIIGSICVDTQSILAQPVLSQTVTSLGNFLKSQHLHEGIGDYWSSSITTVVTNGAVTVRPVISNPNGEIVRYGRQSSEAWYKGQSFQFLVYTTSPAFGVSSGLASKTFGPPEYTYVIGTFRVLVWNHPLSVSPVGGYDP